MLKDHIIYCAHSDLHKVEQLMENKLGSSKNSKLICKPSTTTSLNLQGAQKFFKFVNALEDDDDVQSVTSNVEIPDEMFEQLR